MIENIIYDCELANGSFDSIKDRLGYINDIDALDSCGSTLLLSACANRQIEFVKYFIELGANVNFLDECGNTPLLSVIDSCSEDEDTSLQIVSILLEAGANIELRGYMDKTPFLKACSRNSLSMIQLLVTRGCNVHAKIKEYDIEYGGLYFVGIFNLNRKLRSYVKSICNS